MTAARSLTKLGKQPGKQIQDAPAIWGSTPTRRDGKLSGGLALSFGAARLGRFEARYMPKLVVRVPRPTSCYFPHASPVSSTRLGKQKTALKDRFKPLISLRTIGAGEGIRTLDPNLGKVIIGLR